MADNWYIVLGLECDPPEMDELRIAMKIEERAQFWAAHFQDPQQGNAYRNWHQSLPQIKKDMLGATNIRAKLAKEAAATVYGSMDRMLKTLGRKGHITTEEAARAAKKLQVSAEVLQKRAVRLGIAVKQSAVSENAPAENTHTCRCGYVNILSEGQSVCGSCGLELVIRCPQCGTENPSNITTCRCGYPYVNIDRSRSLCEAAEQAMEALDFQRSADCLTEAVNLWNDNVVAAMLRRQLDDYELQVGREVTQMRTAMAQKRYIAARGYYGALRQKMPDFCDATVEEEITLGVAKAKQIYRVAQSARSQRDVLRLCAEAYDHCADLPGIQELMEQYPPKAVQGFAVQADPDQRCNILSWQADEEETAVRYRLIRSKNGPVSKCADGEQLLYGTDLTYCDRDIEPGVTYYYNVFADRAGVLSDGVENGAEVANLFELSGIEVIEADASLRLAWKDLPNNATVDIYRVDENGGEFRIASGTPEGARVTGLQNDVTYHLRVVLTYRVGGKRRESEGTLVTGTPSRPAAAVETLRMKPLLNGEFQAEWDHCEAGAVWLFGAVELPKYQCGDVVTLDALRQEMMVLLPHALQEENTAILRYPNEDIEYVVAVVEQNGKAVFGKTARAGQGEMVQIKRVSVVNDKIHIYLRAPEKADSFVLLYRHDRFAQELTDPEAVRCDVPMGLYRHNDAIVLDDPEEKQYYFTVFALFARDGDDNVSAPAEYLFDHRHKICITYSISVVHRLFSENIVTMTFQADQENFCLPEIAVMAAEGNVPMFKNTAQHFYDVPSQQVKGTCTVHIPIPRDTPKNTYIKAFFRDDTALSSHQLQLKLKSHHKIT